LRETAAGAGAGTHARDEFNAFYTFVFCMARAAQLKVLIVDGIRGKRIDQ
jgi:hypothetical protein